LEEGEKEGRGEIGVASEGDGMEGGESGGEDGEGGRDDECASEDNLFEVRKVKGDVERWAAEPIFCEE
jgi:hypothetical protein